MAKIPCRGITVSYETTPGSSTYTSVGQVKAIDMPEWTRSVADTSELADDYISKSPGITDGGELSFDFNFDPDHATAALIQLDLTTAGGLARKWKVTLSDTTPATWVWDNSFVIKYKPKTFGVGQWAEASCTVALSGKPTIA